MTPEEFLPLASIKTKCGISGTDLDDNLTTYRAAAIGTIESRTRRNILDREISAMSPDSGGGKFAFITFYVHDAKPVTAPIEIRYRSKQEQPGFKRDAHVTVHQDLLEVVHDRVRAYNGAAGADGTVEVSAWPDRDATVFFEARFNVGIPAGEAPAEFEAAALMLVRELQEGSAMDALPHNIVDLVLKDHVRPAFTATDELLASAGVT